MEKITKMVLLVRGSMLSI